MANPDVVAPAAPEASSTKEKKPCNGSHTKKKRNASKPATTTLVVVLPGLKYVSGITIGCFCQA
eukprot:scaffold114476_cov36-Attheya_sp.AAC.3